MPTYDFRCPVCDTTFEANTAPGTSAPCPECGAEETKRLWSAPHFGASYLKRGAAARDDQARRAEKVAKRRGQI